MVYFTVLDTIYISIIHSCADSTIMRPTVNINITTVELSIV